MNLSLAVSCSFLMSVCLAGTANAADMNILATYEGGKNLVDDVFTMHGTNGEIIAFQCGQAGNRISISLDGIIPDSVEDAKAEISDTYFSLELDGAKSKSVDGRLSYFNTGIDRSYLARILVGLREKTSFLLKVQSPSGSYDIIVHNATRDPRADRVFNRFALECQAQ